MVTLKFLIQASIALHTMKVFLSGANSERKKYVQIREVFSGEYSLILMLGLTNHNQARPLISLLGKWLQYNSFVNEAYTKNVSNC